MDLTKKSVSDIERANKCARIAMRILKECNLVKEFIEYTNTATYDYFATQYANKNNTTTHWCDRKKCVDVFGCCNFESFLSKKWLKPVSVYELTFFYLALFDEKEYMDVLTSNKYIYHYVIKLVSDSIEIQKYSGKNLANGKIVNHWFELKKSGIWK
jgi:hypothetical protein